MGKTTRNAISNDQKREICQYKKDNPKAKNVELISHFEKKFNRQFGKSTMTEILQNSSLYLTNFNSNNQFRMRKAAHPELEDALHIWYCDKRSKCLPISDDLLTDKAKYFGSEFYGLHNVDFKYSTGWLGNFKDRFGITIHTVHGEAASVDTAYVARERIKLYDISRQYDRRNIFNFDETALFYKLPPNKTLSDIGVAAIGEKYSKERLTIAFCASACGEKYRPLVIGKYKRPRCFGKHFDPNKIVDYYYNNTAWMVVPIWDDWLCKFNKHMKNQNREVLLYVDHAAGHGKQATQLSNVRVEYLPPNTTSQMQPMDQGIINVGKGNYKKRLVKKMLDGLDESDKIVYPNVKEALYMLVGAWNDVFKSI